MIAVPEAMAVTAPAAFTEAIAGEDELHVPPEVVSVRGAVAPVHNAVLPVIVPATGIAFTVTIRLVAALPQLFVTI